MKSKLFLMLGAAIVLGLLPVAAVAQQAAPTSTPSPPTDRSPMIQMPDPGGTVVLAPGCNNITLTFPDGTASNTVVQAVTPAGALEAMWRYDAALETWQGYSPAAPPAASDLPTVDFLDSVWLCVNMPSAVGLSEEDSGTTVQLRVGDTMDVTLDGNPTTGFAWETAAVDVSVLKQLGEPEYVPDPHPVGLVGSGGRFTFRFEAVASGQTVLRLIYHRPWEKDVPPEKTFEVTVTVQ